MIAPAERAATLLRKRASIVDAHREAVQRLQDGCDLAVAELTRSHNDTLAALSGPLAELLAEAHQLDERPPKVVKAPTAKSAAAAAAKQGDGA